MNYRTNQVFPTATRSIESDIPQVLVDLIRLAKALRKHGLKFLMETSHVSRKKIRGRTVFLLRILDALVFARATPPTSSLGLVIVAAIMRHFVTFGLQDLRVDRPHHKRLHAFCAQRQFAESFRFVCLDQGEL